LIISSSHPPRAAPERSECRANISILLGIGPLPSHTAHLLPQDRGNGPGLLAGRRLPGDRSGNAPAPPTAAFLSLPAASRLFQEEPDRPPTQRLRLSACARRVRARGLSSSPEDAPRHLAFPSSSTSFHPLLPTPSPLGSSAHCHCRSALRRIVARPRPRRSPVAWSSK
jgi:hypothetical protein